MDASHATSQDKLDQLLAEGRITEAEHARLAEAMAGRADQETPVREAAPVAAEARQLTKSSRHRQLGGVCAGVAEHLGVAPAIPRVVAVVLLIVLPPATLFVYVLLYFALPWDYEAALPADERPRPLRFALAMFGLLNVLPAVILVLLVHWMTPEPDYGVPGPESAPQFAGGASVFSVVLGLAVVLVATSTYRSFRSPARRRTYVIVCVALGVILNVVIALLPVLLA